MLVAQTVPVVIIDDSAGLKMRVNRDRAHVLKTTGFQIFADSVRQTIAHRVSFATVVPLIEYRFSSGVSPDIVAEASEFFADLLIASGVVDYCLHLSRRTDHALCIQNSLNICLFIGGNPVKVEIVEAAPEDIAFF